MRSVIAMRPRSVLALVLAAAIALVMFFWPLFMGPESALSDENTAPLIFALCLPLVLGVVLSEIAEIMTPPPPRSCAHRRGSTTNCPR